MNTSHDTRIVYHAVFLQASLHASLYASISESLFDELLLCFIDQLVSFLHSIVIIIDLLASHP